MLITNSNLQLLGDTFLIVGDYDVQVSSNVNGNIDIHATSKDVIFSCEMVYNNNKQFSDGCDVIMDIVEYINELETISGDIYKQNDITSDGLCITNIKCLSK